MSEQSPNNPRYWDEISRREWAQEFQPDDSNHFFDRATILAAIEHERRMNEARMDLFTRFTIPFIHRLQPVSILGGPAPTPRSPERVNWRAEGF